MTVEFLQTNGGCHTLPESWLSFLQAIGGCVTLFLSIGETSGLIRGVGMKFDVVCYVSLGFMFSFWDTSFALGVGELCGRKGD